MGINLKLILIVSTACITVYNWGEMPKKFEIIASMNIYKEM